MGLVQGVQKPVCAHSTAHWSQESGAGVRVLMSQGARETAGAEPLGPGMPG